ncbi:hypothetical protein VN97_g6584 [Penicillium thymicola]|uniref:Uncharacterized protein n=1 Tax=Penicillium thymicola TaxID=293382 RepID=A0AAI9X7H7_PENTH|nr:hypothetical protein VN97_g6584 [Penicillium thymicola]
MLGKSKRRNKKADTIKYILFVLPTQLMALSHLETSPTTSVELRRILGAITPVIKLEEKYTNKEMGDNVAVNITKDRDGYTFEVYQIRECQPSAWPYTSSQDRRPSTARVIPASQVAEVSTLTMEINKHLK